MTGTCVLKGVPFYHFRKLGGIYLWWQVLFWLGILYYMLQRWIKEKNRMWKNVFISRACQTLSRGKSALSPLLLLPLQSPVIDHKLSEQKTHIQSSSPSLVCPLIWSKWTSQLIQVFLKRLPMCCMFNRLVIWCPVWNSLELGGCNVWHVEQ